ncbi:sensor histidine kinase [Saccharospirillum impatiens]|uniref:sensor histidine kinase n=1 Tax=Saccharospirillum impatiens TaxID=169438 RepID=UPI00041AEB12|nr:ATP-binding protein [Saccharospirillum impatiens]
MTLRTESDRPFKPSWPQRFSVLSSFFGLALVAYFYLITEPDLLSYYQIPGWVLDPRLKMALCAIFLIFLINDAHRFAQARRQQKQQARQLQDEYNHLWQSRKQLQHKVHTYAGHADKLKLFISDKLLEYIEYDEKFLHFKSIAAEVRHNGVIGFDKVQSALELALAQPELSETDQTRTREALQQLRYVWDLLDLATTDNIALHLANQLCDLEEPYYQQSLNPESADSHELQPTFSPVAGLVRALTPLLNTPESLHTAVAEGLPCQWQDDPSFWLLMEPCGVVLGNENHWVLLLENLLKNAQFFSGKRPYRHKYRRIGVRLLERSGKVRLQVFNSGPGISEEDKTKIFQLGYSTRRVKENHGKGLGLFFVGEIVKGYDGSIAIENIVNNARQMTLRLEFENGDVHTDSFTVQIEDDLPVCQRHGVTDTEKTLNWSFEQPLRSVEVSSADAHQPQIKVLDTSLRSINWLDPQQPDNPAWVLDISLARKHCGIQFTPLDVRGVQFTVELPLAASRLTEDATLEDLDSIDVDRLNQPFQALDLYHESNH